MLPDILKETGFHRTLHRRICVLGTGASLYLSPHPHLHPDWLELLKVIGWSRNFMVEDDDGVDRAARTLMKDFQMCRFGHHTLEHPDTAIITSPLFRGNEQK